MATSEIDIFLSEYKKLCIKHSKQINVKSNVLGLILGMVVEEDLDYLDENIEYLSQATTSL